MQVDSPIDVGGGYSDSHHAFLDRLGYGLERPIRIVWKDHAVSKKVLQKSASKKCIAHAEVWLVMHPHEAYKPTNTGLLIKDVLPIARIFHGRVRLRMKRYWHSRQRCRLTRGPNGTD